MFSTYFTGNMSIKPSHERSVLIVGGGTFGTSTAYHLSLRGYKSVKVLDRWAPPSQEAAGNDRNKVIRVDYPEPLYAKLASEAREIWRDANGMFAGLYHKTGWILAPSKATLPFIDASIKTAGELGLEQAQEISINDVKSQWPAFEGPMNGWTTYWNPGAGWVNAREALAKMANAAANNGVEYVTFSSIWSISH